MSAGLSLLYAHCWSRSLSLFLIRQEDGAGPLCSAVFYGFQNQEGSGAEERSIWILWIVIMVITLIIFAQDEFSGLHTKEESVEHSILFQGPLLKRKHSVTDEFLDYSSDDSSSSGENILSHTVLEEPKDTLDMVPWLSLFAAHSTIDIFLQLKVFLGRVDARSMQTALQQRIRTDYKSRISNFDNHQDRNETLQRVKETYPGCVFDHTSRASDCISDGFWFDFVADVGDGFNSSYQIARKLAQPNLIVMKDKEYISLPRGQCLFNGGDLG